MERHAFDIVYGVIGTKASGKGEFGDHLKTAGFSVYTLSAPIKVQAEREIGKYDVFDLMRIGDKGRRAYGSGYWAGETLLLASQGGHRKVVIDGIRNPGEISRLRELLGSRLVLVGITAPTLIRYRRVLNRARPGDPADIKDFLVMDDTDRGVSQPADGQQVDRCMAQVPIDHLFNNRGTLKEFHAWIDAFHTDALERVNIAALYEESQHYID